MKRLLPALFLLLASPVYATVYINEISTYQSTGDWVELFADEEEDISGWIIKDSTSTIKTIPADTKIGAPQSSILVFTVSNRLNRDEDVIELFDLNDNLIDSISYGYDDAICAPEDNQSIGRRLIDPQVWIRYTNSTQAEENSGDESPCPTPTPAPKPSPTPEISPSPTPDSTPTPTPAPTPARTPTPSPSTTPTSTPDLVEKEGTVAGLQIDSIHLEEVESPSPSPDSLSDVPQPTLNKDRARTALFVGSGLIFISFTLYLGYNKFNARDKL